MLAGAVVALTVIGVAALPPAGWAAPPTGSVPPAGSVPPLAAQANADSLGAAATARGRTFGAAVAANKLSDPVYTDILNREFSSVTPENSLEWDAVEPARGQFNFAMADRVINHALANGMRARARGPVTPGADHLLWLANVSRADMPGVLANHITATMTHFRGKIQTWDVVSEAFWENGTMRSTVFQRQLGAGYIEMAFRAARAADPTARLCYNDYYIEDLATVKTQAVLAMVKDFKTRGVPIDCVGLESHFTFGLPAPATYQRTIADFAALGVDVEITELDIEGSGSTQADQYNRVVSACLAVARCTGITVWGIRDVDSWRGNMTPLLFDGSGNRKPAYYGVLCAFTLCCPPAPV